MGEIALFMLDIAENSFFAGATKTEITLTESQEQVILEIEDNGLGMDKETLMRFADPFFSSKGKIGLGVALLKSSAEQTGGSFSAVSQKGKGTKITAVFNKKHIDCPPIGDTVSALAVLVTSKCRILYTHKNGTNSVKLDTDMFSEENSECGKIISVKNYLHSQYAEFHKLKGSAL